MNKFIQHYMNHEDYHSFIPDVEVGSQGISWSMRMMYQHFYHVLVKINSRKLLTFVL